MIIRLIGSACATPCISVPATCRAICDVRYGRWSWCRA